MVRRWLREIPLCDPIAGVVIAMIVTGAGLSAMVLAIPLYAISAYHKRKIEEIRARQTKQIDENTRQAIEALRQEMIALRDTTTQYDVGFDSVLRRLDGRVENLEQRVTHAERQVERPGDVASLHRTE